MGAPLVDAIYVQNGLMNTAAGDLEAFLACYYRACEELIADPEARSRIALEWYASEGRKYTDADMAVELQRQTYPTLDLLMSEKYPFGLTMTNIAEFFVKQGMIPEENHVNVPESMDNSFVAKLKAAK